jgi:hypothetical protein
MGSEKVATQLQVVRLRLLFHHPEAPLPHVRFRLLPLLRCGDLATSQVRVPFPRPRLPQVSTRTAPSP